VNFFYPTQFFEVICKAHHTKGCQSAPASNGRRQRARNQELCLDRSPEASEASDSGDSDGSSESQASEDQRFRREMDQYDRIMARAHEIAENDRQRQTQELDSDSDLSVLASSLFNGMEGIEHDSGTLVQQGGGVRTGKA